MPLAAAWRRRQKAAGGLARSRSRRSRSPCATHAAPFCTSRALTFFRRREQEEAEVEWRMPAVKVTYNDAEAVVKSVQDDGRCEIVMLKDVLVVFL